MVEVIILCQVSDWQLSSISSLTQICIDPILTIEDLYSSVYFSSAIHVSHLTSQVVTPCSDNVLPLVHAGHGSKHEDGNWEFDRGTATVVNQISYGCASSLFLQQVVSKNIQD